MQWSITVTILYGFALLNSGVMEVNYLKYVVIIMWLSDRFHGIYRATLIVIFPWLQLSLLVSVFDCQPLSSIFYVFQFKCFEGCKACRHFSLFLNETFLDLTSADTDILCKNEIKHKYSGEHLKDENACNSLIGEPNCFIMKLLKDNTTCKDDLIIIVISQKL